MSSEKSFSPESVENKKIVSFKDISRGELFKFPGDDKTYFKWAGEKGSDNGYVLYGERQKDGSLNMGKEQQNPRFVKGDEQVELVQE